MPVKAIENCKKCGLPWIGADKCECGWAPDANWRVIKLLVAVVLVLGIIAAIYLSEHFHQFFPDEKSADQHVVKGDDDLHRGDFPEAVEEFKTAAFYAPKRAQIKEKLAVALLNVQRPNEALEAMRQAVQLAPTDKKLAQELAVLLEQNGHDGEAAQVLKSALKDEPKDSLLRFHLAELYEKAGDLNQASALYAEFTRIKPRLNGPWLGLARVQLAQGKKADAVSTLRNAVSALPQDGILHQNLGIALGGNKETDEAVKELLLSARLTPALTDADSDAIAVYTAGTKPIENTVPLTAAGNDYLVDVLVNDRTRLKFVVDPNVEATLVSPVALQKTGVSPASGTPALIQGPAGAVVTKRINFDSIKIGAVKDLLIPAMISPFGGKLDGVLGMTYLHRYSFSIDPQRKVLILRRRSS